MSTIYKRGPARIAANLTPMIDVTFLLIVFFVLVSQIVEAENAEMDLPTPTDPQSQVSNEKQRAVINVLPGPNGAARGYRLGTRTFSPETRGVEQLQSALMSIYQQNPNLKVHLRADRATDYIWVEKAMRAIGVAAGAADPPVAPQIHLAIERERDS